MLLLTASACCRRAPSLQLRQAESSRPTLTTFGVRGIKANHPVLLIRDTEGWCPFLREVGHSLSSAPAHPWSQFVLWLVKLE